MRQVDPQIDFFAEQSDLEHFLLHKLKNAIRPTRTPSDGLCCGLISPFSDFIAH